jgi:hypothetical protein
MRRQKQPSMPLRFALAALAVMPLIGNRADAQPSSSAVLVVVPVILTSTGQPGGPFMPPSFQYRLSAKNGAVDYLIDAPPWVTVDLSKGTVDVKPITIDLAINATAKGLPPGTYLANVRFSNVTSRRGSTSRGIKLIVLGSEINNDGGYLIGDDLGEWLIGRPGERLLAR